MVFSILYQKKIPKVYRMQETFFETIRCDDYEVFHLPYHQERISNTIGLNIDLNEYIYPPNASLLKCKVLYSEEGILNIEFSAYKKREITSFQLVYDDEIEYKNKSSNREKIDELFLQKNQSDEIIIIKNGLVTDTSIANIAIFDGSSWLTPKQPLLYGTTRARLLKEGAIFEKDISIEMLQQASKIALLNAMIDMDVLQDYSLSV